MNISTDKNSRDTPTSTTYPSSGKIGGGIIKLYQSRCFYIEKGERGDLIQKSFELSFGGDGALKPGFELVKKSGLMTLRMFSSEA